MDVKGRGMGTREAIVSGKKGERRRTFLVTKTARYRAHEHFDGADIASIRRGTVSLIESHGLAELLFRDCAGSVDFVAENNEGHVAEFISRQETLYIVFQLHFTIQKKKYR